MASLSIILFALVTSQNPVSTTYTYADGSGNVYSLSMESFEYDPVTKEESSSGMYDGGKPVKNVPDNALFNHAAAIIEKAKADTTQHTPDRNKMTGVITIKSGNENTRFILKSGSSYKEDLEKILKAMKGNP